MVYDTLAVAADLVEHCFFLVRSDSINYQVLASLWIGGQVDNLSELAWLQGDPFISSNRGRTHIRIVRILKCDLQLRLIGAIGLRVAPS